MRHSVALVFSLVLVLSIPAVAKAVELPLFLSPQEECPGMPAFDCESPEQHEVGLTPEGEAIFESFRDFFSAFAANNCSWEGDPDFNAQDIFTPAFKEFMESLSDDFWMNVGASPLDGTQYGPSAFTIVDIVPCEEDGRPGCHILFFLSGCTTRHAYLVVSTDRGYQVDDVYYFWGDEATDQGSSLRDMYSEYLRDNG